MTPAAIALAQFTQRRAYLARTGTPAAEAEAKLRPWAAIALRAGSDLALISLHVATAHEDYRCARLTDSQARACTAADLCSLPTALAELARARDAAIDHVPEPTAPEFPQASAAAHQLQVLAAYLGAPAYRPTKSVIPANAGTQLAQEAA